MKIKTFRARTFGEALALVKKEMGEDAVIVSTEEKRGPRPSVEVGAAVDYEVGEAAAPRAAIPSWATPILPSAKPPSPVFEQEEVRQLKHSLAEFKAEVVSIRELLEDTRTGTEADRLPTGKRDVLRFLKERGVREEHARGICNTANSVMEIPQAMVGGVAVREKDTAGKKAVVLIGPTGVGKTTTVAKLAASAVKAGKRVAIVSLDGYRIGAIEQVRIYAKIMGVPLEVVPDARQIKACLAKHADKDVVYIDTTGRNPLDGAFLSELAPLYESGVPVETHLLVSATSDYDFLAGAWKSYARLPVDCVGVTKVDEAARHGALYNVSALCGKPIAYLTNGQTVPGDIVFPTREKVLKMILLERSTGAAPAAAAQR
jgi:flagellar biosynthesis protein FlhF